MVVVGIAGRRLSRTDLLNSLLPGEGGLLVSSALPPIIITKAERLLILHRKIIIFPESGHQVMAESPAGWI